MTRRQLLKGFSLGATGLYVPTRTFFLPPSGAGWLSPDDIWLRWKPQTLYWPHQTPSPWVRAIATDKVYTRIRSSRPRNPRRPGGGEPFEVWLHRKRRFLEIVREKEMDAKNLMGWQIHPVRSPGRLENLQVRSPE